MITIISGESIHKIVWYPEFIKLHLSGAVLFLSETDRSIVIQNFNKKRDIYCNACNTFEIQLMEDILNKVKEFADQAHGEQKRKYTGERYIVHPVRVMNICRQYTDNPVVLSAALLHDVLEDTPVGKDNLYRFVENIMGAEASARVVDLVVALTDVYVKEKFPLLNRKRRKKKESERLAMIPADAQTIKYADIIDNTMDITHNDPDFAPFYLRECRSILTGMKDGNPELLKRAIESVEGNLLKFQR